MEAKLSIWLFIPALIILCLAFAYVMMRIKKKTHVKDIKKALHAYKRERARIIKRNRKVLGDTVVDNILRNNPECCNMTDARESGVR